MDKNTKPARQNPNPKNRRRAKHPSDDSAPAPARRICVFLPAMSQQPARVTDGCAENQGDPKPGRRISVTASSSGLTGADCPPAGPERVEGSFFDVFDL